MTRRCVLCGLLALLASGARGADRDFAPQQRGDDLKQFEVVGLGPGSMTIRDGEVRLAGKPEGYFATKEEYRNYVLRFEWLYERPAKYRDGEPFHGNSGVLLHAQGPSRVWPRALEVQVWYKHQYGDFYTHNGARFGPTRDDHAALSKLLKPVGQWNRHEITCQDGAVVVRVNGTEVGRGKGAGPDRGRVGWMAEGSPIRFRNLLLKKLD
jgi:hypothetical protein